MIDVPESHMSLSPVDSEIENVTTILNDRWFSTVVFAFSARNTHTEVFDFFISQYDTRLLQGTGDLYHICFSQFGRS